MKIYSVIFLLLIGCYNIFAQSDLNNLVETEKKFAQTAFDENTKTAFWEFLADDSIVFVPMAKNGKEHWQNQNESASVLVWSPAFADISSNGVLGYTTGPWELRTKGQNDTPTVFGHYIKVWQKRPDGKFKVVLDIGISHSKVNLSNKWNSPDSFANNQSERRKSAADTSTDFFEMIEKISVEKAYKKFAADDIRLYREGKLPFLGKKSAVNEVKNFKDKIRFSKLSIFTSASDLAYISNTYSQLDKSGKEIAQGNFLQIWKYRNGQWQIVLDIFKLLPQN